MADEDGLAIQNGLVYAFLKFARFMVDFGLIFVAESPIYSQDGVYYFPSDPKIPGTDFRVGMNPERKFKRYKGLGSLDKEEVFDAFYNEKTRRLFQVVPDGSSYAMRLVEDIDARKSLLFEKGILSNPYNFTDL